MKTQDISKCGIGAALLCVCSWISVPAPIPFTLQTLGVFLLVGLLGGRRGSIAVLVYLLLGAVGLPVFSGFNGGPGALLGPTGGFIIGLAACALVMWLLTARLGNSPGALALAMLMGLLVCYALGTAWFLLMYAGEGATLSSALSKCVLPFLLPDALKGALALFITARIRRMAPARQG